ncbi:MAG TPA: ribosome silencing factor [Candidatus Treponema faecavium]|nr:ribosome silencing factor [Candidatus Treponema faecavium]
MKTLKEKALELAQILEDGKGENVCVIDVSEISSWTDYFIIVTVHSSVLAQGLYKDIKDFTKSNDLQIHVPNRKNPSGDDWILVDIGSIVVHLMSSEARDFYDLEKLWFNGKKIC